MAACKHKMGLLSLQSCGQVAYQQCCHCNKAVCEDHYQSSNEGTFCLSCYAKAGKNVDVHDERMDRIHRRRHYHDHYGYYPYWHHGHHYNDFDRDANQAAGPIGETMVTDDTDDSGNAVDANDFQDS